MYNLWWVLEETQEDHLVAAIPMTSPKKCVFMRGEESLWKVAVEFTYGQCIQGSVKTNSKGLKEEGKKCWKAVKKDRNCRKAVTLSLLPKQPPNFSLFPEHILTFCYVTWMLWVGCNSAGYSSQFFWALLGSVLDWHDSSWLPILVYSHSGCSHGGKIHSPYRTAW